MKLVRYFLVSRYYTLNYVYMYVTCNQFHNVGLTFKHYFKCNLNDRCEKSPKRLSHNLHHCIVYIVCPCILNIDALVLFTRTSINVTIFCK